MLAGEQPACWECERTALGPEDADALHLQGLLELGMSWELALDALSWTGTAEELRALARKVRIIRSETGEKT
jgi:hypothetical protein